METILTIALIFSLILHTRWLDGYKHGEVARPAVWFRKDGFHVGMKYGYGSFMSRRVFFWPWWDKSRNPW